MNAFHLKGLDTVRAIAALAVIVGHIELQKSTRGLPSLMGLPYFRATSGHTAVILFFVLSGFLITLLLLRERSTSGAIDVRGFYMRRVLRIWPLYYLVLAGSAVVLAYRPGFSTALMCLTILPNLAHATGHKWEASPQIWSIGVEEQFYLAWPFVVSGLAATRLPVLIGLVTALTLAPHALLSGLAAAHAAPDWLDTLVYTSKFDVMAMGGVVAVLHHRKEPVLFILKHPVALMASTVLPITMWLSGFTCGVFTDEVYGVLFAVMILNLATSDQRIVGSDSRLGSLLGRISYGLYMYHWVVLVLVLDAVEPFFLRTPEIANAGLYAGTISVTVGISLLSFHTVERFFLNRRRYQQT